MRHADTRPKHRDQIVPTSLPGDEKDVSASLVDGVRLESESECPRDDRLRHPRDESGRHLGPRGRRAPEHLERADHIHLVYAVVDDEIDQHGHSPSPTSCDEPLRCILDLGERPAERGDPRSDATLHRASRDSLQLSRFLRRPLFEVDELQGSALPGRELPHGDPRALEEICVFCVPLRARFI